MYNSTIVAPVDKKDPEFIRQRQVEYQREYRRREAERRAATQQFVAIAPTPLELQQQISQMRNDINTKDETLNNLRIQNEQYITQIKTKNESIQQYATMVQEVQLACTSLQNRVLHMENEIKIKDGIIQQKDQSLNNLRDEYENKISLLQEALHKTNIAHETSKQQIADLSTSLNNTQQEIKRLETDAMLGKQFLSFKTWLTQYPNESTHFNSWIGTYNNTLSK